MAKLIITLAILTAGYLIYKLHFQKLLEQGKAGKIKIALIALGVFFLIMAATGRASVIFALIGAALTQVMRFAPLLMRHGSFIQKILGAFGFTKLSEAFGTVSPNGTSSVRTRSLVISVNPINGSINGDVLNGPLAGKRLDQLSLAELKTLLEYCSQSDPEAINLLHSYVQKERPEWIQDIGREHQSSAATTSDSISIREAYDILGLSEGATRSDVTQAHRTLMTQLHPDKGGSNYLAAKVNEAKKKLLSHIPND